MASHRDIEQLSVDERHAGTPPKENARVITFDTFFLIGQPAPQRL
jgi:hypothetical protein